MAKQLVHILCVGALLISGSAALHLCLAGHDSDADKGGGKNDESKKTEVETEVVKWYPGDDVILTVTKVTGLETCTTYVVTKKLTFFARIDGEIKEVELEAESEPRHADHDGAFVLVQSATAADAEAKMIAAHPDQVEKIQKAFEEGYPDGVAIVDTDLEFVF